MQHISTTNLLRVAWIFNSSSRASAISWCEVPDSSSTDSRRHWIKRSRKSVPLLGSSATNLSTFAAWVACSVNSSWKSAVIRWYLLRYGRRVVTFSSLRNLKWHFWRTLTLTELRPGSDIQRCWICTSSYIYNVYETKRSKESRYRNNKTDIYTQLCKILTCSLLLLHDSSSCRDQCCTGLARSGTAYYFLVPIPRAPPGEKGRRTRTNLLEWPHSSGDGTRSTLTLSVPQRRSLVYSPRVPHGLDCGRSFGPMLLVVVCWQDLFENRGYVASH